MEQGRQSRATISPAVPDGPMLYLGVLVFNLTATFDTQDHTLGWVSVFIIKKNGL